MKISRKEAAEKLDQIHQAAGFSTSYCCGKVVALGKGEDKPLLEFEGCSRKGAYRLSSSKYSIACCAEHANFNSKSEFGFEDETIFCYEMALLYPIQKREESLLDALAALGD